MVFSVGQFPLKKISQIIYCVILQSQSDVCRTKMKMAQPFYKYALLSSKSPGFEGNRPVYWAHTCIMYICVCMYGVYFCSVTI